MGLRSRLLTGGLGALALMGGAGCEENTDFAYFKVRATLAGQVDAAFLEQVASCGVNVVSGTDGRLLDFAPFATSRCTQGQVRSADLGLIDWSTAETSGTVRFVVVVKNSATREIAKGMSAPFEIRPNATTEGTVQVDRLPDPPMM
jgi:hypothetical protein